MKKYFFGILIVSLFFSCGDSQNKIENSEKTTTLNIREVADGQSLNPLNYTAELSGIINTYLFQTLTAIDYQSMRIIPLLVENLPEKDSLKNGNIKYTYTLRNEARWDNGKPIVAKDVDFSIKLLKIPNPENSFHPYENIIDFQYDTTNNKRFSIIIENDFFESLFQTGDIYVLPQFNYDSTHFLDNYTIVQIDSLKDELLKRKEFLDYLQALNNIQYNLDPKYIVGSGPYQLKEWKIGEKITLIKKPNWYAENLKTDIVEFNNHIDKIVYHIIPDETAAITALKNGKIDLIRSISPKTFNELKENATFSSQFNFLNPPILAYYSIGLNFKNPILASKNNRKALAHLVDYDNMIKIITYGYADRIHGPIPKSFDEIYNSNLEAYQYSIETSQKLLAEESWKDSDKDGIIEKIIKGKKTNFELNFLVNSGNENGKMIALMLMENAKKVGIKITIQEVEWSIYLQKSKNSDFDMIYSGKSLSPTSPNHKPLFHTQSISEGSNQIAYSNKIIDTLIDSINNSTNESVRIRLYHQFQEIIMEDVPYIFLYSPQERMLISNKFTNYNLSALRPGFYAPAFKLKTDD